MPTPLLRARLAAANKKLRAQNNSHGLDLFDRALIGAVKIGLFAMFGLFVANQAEKLKPGILNTLLPPAPTPKRTPRPIP